MNPQFTHHWEKCCQVNHNIMLSCYLELFYDDWKSFQIVRFIIWHSCTPVVKRKKINWLRYSEQIFLLFWICLTQLLMSIFFPSDAPLFLWSILPAARHPMCQFGGWYFLILGLPWWLSLKNLPARADEGSSLSRQDPLEKEMATHSSILAWKIPRIEEPGGLQSMGSKKSQTQLSN